ncbi:S8 family peptidase [Granulicella cerasi]|uniref:S8 family peptidase n=1 Tax=Granulicella cerasi TaxID=741063 RepID=UPI0021DF77E2|nr:S8 family serine peptidase [Granulicella cerasi]
MLQRLVLLFAALLPASLCAQTTRLVVFYDKPASLPLVQQNARWFGARGLRNMPHLNASILTVDNNVEQITATAMRMQPGVLAVVRDRYVSGHALRVRGVRELHPFIESIGAPRRSLASSSNPTTVDAAYNSPAGWAVRASGGYGNSIAGGPSVGPWNSTRGAGVRIAVLDSGIDSNHPDLINNVAINLSEVDQTALPSPCDDGSPQDQQGHGTWVASLAAGALGGGETVGVAPEATLLNIKVLQRMPAIGQSSTLAACEAGDTGGLLSWVLTGINDALAQHADVISLSLGTLVDLTTGDGAGWKTSFDRVTYAAQQAGTVIIAATGNDGIDLSTGRYIELPSQARGVLAVTATTNADCVENPKPNAICAAGPVARASYANFNAPNSIAAPGGALPEGADDATSGWIFGACSSGIANTTDGLPASGKSFGCFGLGHVAYVQAMGTSASAPLLAGAAALLKAAHPAWSAAQIITVLQTSATPSIYMSERQLNLPAALYATP